MEIQYLGISSFRLTTKETSIVMDPYDPKRTGLKFPKVSAEIVTISHNHPDHNGAEFVEGVKKVISGPGEYEIKGVSFIGIPSFHDNEGGALRGKNTIFVIEMDSLRLAHLGDLGHKLSEEQIGSIGEVDVLMIPVGGEYTIDAKEAYEIVQDIEPKIILPMHYLSEGMGQGAFAKLDKVDPFLSSLGLKVEKLPKLKLKEGDLAGEDQMVVLLNKK